MYNKLQIIMRAILIDWLITVHDAFNCLPSTLYLCVNIVDRYCAMENVDVRNELQKVGISALLIASKHEEREIPDVKTFAWTCDGAYSAKDVTDMEWKILQKLNWRVWVPTVYSFYHLLLGELKAPEYIYHKVQLYTERTLLEHSILKYNPSEICCASVILAYSGDRPHDASLSNSLEINQVSILSILGKCCKYYLYMFTLCLLAMIRYRD